MRTFVFITPTVLEATDESPLRVAVSPVLLETTEEIWEAFGFDSIMAPAPDSSVSEVLDLELAMELRQTEIIPDVGWTHTRLIAWPGDENVFTIPGEHQRFNTIQMTPSAPGADGAIFLETKLGLGHAAQPGMRDVNLNVQYGY